MITQRCPKCRSNRIRRGYRHTSVISKLIFRYNLLCDGCNWEFTGFAFPFEIDTDAKKQSVPEKAAIGINRTNEYWSESVARDSQSSASQYSELDSPFEQELVEKLDVPETDKEAVSEKHTEKVLSGVAKEKGQRSKRSRRRDEKVKKSSSAVSSRSSQDDIARKRTSSAVARKESAKTPAKDEQGTLEVRGRAAVKKTASTKVGGQNIKPASVAATLRSRSKSTGPSKTGTDPANAEVIAVKETGTERKKVVNAIVKKKLAVRKTIPKKPVRKSAP